MDKHTFTMTDTTDYDDNHPVCVTCGCGPCACEEDPDYCNGSDICEPWAVRFDPYYQPADRYGISVLGVLLLATVLAGLIASVGMRAVQAQDTTLRAPHAINGRIYEWPAIGAEVYSRSCARHKSRQQCPSIQTPPLPADNLAHRRSQSRNNAMRSSLAVVLSTLAYRVFRANIASSRVSSSVTVSIARVPISSSMLMTPPAPSLTPRRSSLDTCHLPPSSRCTGP